LPEIRNPNLQTPGTPGGSGGGGDMRSTMAFFVLMLAVLFGYQYFFKPKTAPITPPQTQSQSAAIAAPQVEAARRPDAVAPYRSTGFRSSAPAITAASETETTVENELYKIVFTNRGAQVKSWILKSYKDTAGKPLDMVQPQTAARFGFPLSFFTYEPALTAQLNQVLYQPSATGTGAGPEFAHLPLRRQRPGCGEDLPLRLQLRGLHSIRKSSATAARFVRWCSGLPDSATWRSSGPAKRPAA
jgi:YidC/Oxa1 family membrane protein insertase